MAPATTARTVWLALEDQFVGNRETRALYLDAEFRNFSQGDLSVTDYCRRLKGMADALGDLGKPVQDRTLVLNLIRGLNEKFAVIGTHLQRARPFPSFLVARNDLLLEELNLAKRSSTPSAFVAMPGTGQLLNQHSSGAPQKKEKTPGGQQAAAASGSTGPTSWAPSFLNPWAGTIQMCPGPVLHLWHLFLRCVPQFRCSSLQRLSPMPISLVFRGRCQVASTQGLLAPGAFGQASGAPANFMPPPPGFQNPSVGTSSWDQQALANTFSTMPLQQPWYFDLGATNHMTSDAGILSRPSSTFSSFPSSIVVGNGNLLPVVSTGSTHLAPSLRLNNVLVLSLCASLLPITIPLLNLTHLVL